MYYINTETFNEKKEEKFTILNFIGITKKEEKKEIFVKITSKGKIRESLFYIGSIIYSRYFKEEFLKKDIRVIITRKRKGISINFIQNKKKREKLKIDVIINFIEISNIIELVTKKTEKGWEKNIDIKPKDILIIGIKNEY